MKMHADKSRIDWIDNLKALGIFLVVLGHHRIQPAMVQYIFSFHMPLFFLISGYLFNAQKYKTFKGFLEKKVRTLVIPYFFFAFLAYFFWLFVVRNFSMHGDSLSISPLKVFIDIFYSIGQEGSNVPLNTAIWFLTCLFMVEVFFWCIQRLITNRTALILTIIGFAVLGYVYSIWMPLHLPWSMDIALSALVFYAVGFIGRKDIDALTDFVIQKNLYLVVPIFLIHIIFCFLNERVDMNYNLIGNPVYFYLSAFAGSIFVMIVSKAIVPNRIFSFLGKNTIVILGLTGMSFFILRGAYYLVFKRLPDIDQLALSTGVGFSVLQLLIIAPAIYVINTFIPFVVGRTFVKG